MPSGHREKPWKSCWSIVIDVGRDPTTGRRLRIRRSVKGATKRHAAGPRPGQTPWPTTEP